MVDRRHLAAETERIRLFRLPGYSSFGELTPAQRAGALFFFAGCLRSRLLYGSVIPQEVWVGILRRIPEIFKSPTDLNQPLFRLSAFTDAVEFINTLTTSELHAEIKSLVPAIGKLLKNGDRDVRAAAARALGTLAETPIFHEAIKPFVKEIGKLLIDNHRDVRLAAASTLVELAEKFAFHDAIRGFLSEFKDAFHESVVREISGLLAHGDRGVRNAASYTLNQLAEKCTFFIGRLTRLMALPTSENY
ncbi:hypothetical protein B0H13DRAFT_2306971 [Mycena leptocephala]|nr:hypothetical protein B0H13DRAFT_2306971 [Mycena leptocephala]